MFILATYRNKEQELREIESDGTTNTLIKKAIKPPKAHWTQPRDKILPLDLTKERENSWNQLLSQKTTYDTTIKYTTFKKISKKDALTIINNLAPYSFENDPQPEAPYEKHDIILATLKDGTTLLLEEIDFKDPPSWPTFTSNVLRLIRSYPELNIPLTCHPEFHELQKDINHLKTTNKNTLNRKSGRSYRRIQHL